MKILLDTAHLIRILEKSDPVSASALEAALRAGNHELVLSFATVGELAAPLQHLNATTNVMRLFRALEELPLTYVADIRIDRLELQAAIAAWRQGLEPARIDPFTDRLDRALSLDGSMPPSPPGSGSLSEIVFAMWQVGILGGNENFLSRFRPAVHANRQAGLPDRVGHLIAAVDRHCDLYSISFSRADLPAFGRWLIADWRRAPSTRLQNELFRQLVANTRDAMQRGDFGDLIHTGSLAYVDFMTLDRRMAHYTAQAARAIGSDLSARICSAPESVLERLRG